MCVSVGAYVSMTALSGIGGLARVMQGGSVHMPPGSVTSLFPSRLPDLSSIALRLGALTAAAAGVMLF